MNAHFYTAKKTQTLHWLSIHALDKATFKYQGNNRHKKEVLLILQGWYY